MLRARLLVLLSAASAVLVTWAATENNGDLMYLESLYHHLFTLGRPWREFVFTEATFLFPDALAYVPLRALAGSQPVATALFHLASLALTLTLFDRLYRRHRREADPGERALALALFTLLLATVDRLNRTLFWPNHHGALLPVLLAFLWAGERARPRALALGLGAALVIFSDGVSLMQVFAPLTLYWAWRRNFVAAAATALGVIGGVGLIAAVKAAHLVRVHTATLWPTSGQLAYQFAHLGETVAAWLIETSVFHLLIGALAVFAWRRRRREHARGRGPFALAVVVTFATTLAMGRVLNIYAVRYVLNYFYWSAFAAATCAVPALGTRGRRLMSGALVVAAVAAGAWSFGRGFKFFDRALTECVARAVPYAGAHGVAGFWPAKFITFTGGRTVNQVGPGFTKYLWMNAESWYRPGATFVVTDDQVTGEQARAWFGAPARVETCSPRNEVYLYPGGLPEPATPPGAPD